MKIICIIYSKVKRNMLYICKIGDIYGGFYYQDTEECMKCIDEETETPIITHLGIHQYNSSDYKEDSIRCREFYKCNKNHLFYVTNSIKVYNIKIKELEDKLKVFEERLTNAYIVPTAPIFAIVKMIDNRKI